MHHGLGCDAIAELVKKPNGREFFGRTAISDAMSKLRENPAYRGGREAGSGPPRKTTARQDKQIVDEVYKMRGREKVTVSYLKRKFPFSRKLSETLMEERLAEAGLAYLRRRRKTIVPTEAVKESRLAWQAMVDSPSVLAATATHRRLVIRGCG